MRELKKAWDIAVPSDHQLHASWLETVAELVEVDDVDELDKWEELLSED